jgi:hypothetical protein
MAVREGHDAVHGGRQASIPQRGLELGDLRGDAPEHVADLPAVVGQVALTPEAEAAARIVPLDHERAVRPHHDVIGLRSPKQNVGMRLIVRLGQCRENGVDTFFGGRILRTLPAAASDVSTVEHYPLPGRLCAGGSYPGPRFRGTRAA